MISRMIKFAENAGNAALALLFLVLAVAVMV
jgi:hypothetical protein